MRKLKEPQENTEKTTQCNQENTKEQNKKFDKGIEIIKKKTKQKSTEQLWAEEFSEWNKECDRDHQYKNRSERRKNQWVIR